MDKSGFEPHWTLACTCAGVLQPSTGNVAQAMGALGPQNMAREMQWGVLSNSIITYNGFNGGVLTFQYWEQQP